MDTPPYVVGPQPMLTRAKANFSPAILGTRDVFPGAAANWS